MSHYAFTRTFRALYDQAVSAYTSGAREPGKLFNDEQTRWLAANGLTAQNFHDYAEDQTNYGEPGYDHALAIELVRRDYFLNVQKGVASKVVADPETWPAKTDAIDGIVWLPRILPKVRAKLRGELPASMMYCCGGDRRFLKELDILPAEFLALAWRAGTDDQAIIDWVKARGRRG